MNISEQGMALIKQFEGFSATPYQCPAGKWTIGYGHTSPHLLRVHVTEEEAHALLLRDLEPMQKALKRLVTVPLTQNQYDALASFIYNVGIWAFAGSTLLRKLNAKTQGVEKEFLRWIYAGKEVLPGLITRRQDEMNLFIKQ